MLALPSTGYHAPMEHSRPRAILAFFAPLPGSAGPSLAGLFHGIAATAKATGHGDSEGGSPGSTPWTPVIDAALAIVEGSDPDAAWSCLGAIQYLVTRPDQVPHPAALHALDWCRADGRLGLALNRLADPGALGSPTGIRKLMALFGAWRSLGGLMAPEPLMALAPVLVRTCPLLLPLFWFQVVRPLAGEDPDWIGLLLQAPNVAIRLAGYQIILHGNFDPGLLRWYRPGQDAGARPGSPEPEPALARLRGAILATVQPEGGDPAAPKAVTLGRQGHAESSGNPENPAPPGNQVSSLDAGHDLIRTWHRDLDPARLLDQWLETWESAARAEAPGAPCPAAPDSDLFIAAVLEGAPQ